MNYVSYLKNLHEVLVFRINYISLKFLTIYSNLSEKTQNCLLRCIFGVIMISVFCCAIYWGPFTIIGLLYFIQVMAYIELMGLYKKFGNVECNSMFKLYSWTTWTCYNYYLIGENLLKYKWKEEMPYPIHELLLHHHLICFLIYLVFLIAFCTNLKPDNYQQQYFVLSYVHCGTFLVVTPIYLAIQNLQFGIFWFVMPMSTVIFNDIAAYFVGGLFGRTQLIQVSPRKTWEGYLGGAILTIFFNLFLTLQLIKFPYIICPPKYIAATTTTTTTADAITAFQYNCSLSELPLLQTYPLDLPIVSHLLGLFTSTSHLLPLVWSPILCHSLLIALFASFIGPFGGFFASGLKRSINIRDFSSRIPGHGGFLDRFDCCILVSSFVYFYCCSMNAA